MSSLLGIEMDIFYYWVPYYSTPMIANVFESLISTRRIFLLYLLLLALFFSRCTSSHDKKDSFEFDFTHSNLFEAFAMKYTGNDTLFVREYYSHDKLPYAPDDYFQKISSEDLDTLSLLINNINLSKLDTVYPNLGPMDRPFYGVYLKKGAISKTAYGQTPKALKLLIDYLIKMRARLQLMPIDSSITFKSGPRIPDEMDKSGTIKFLPKEE